MDSYDFPSVAELLKSSPHRNPGNSILLRQLRFAGQPGVWRESADVDVGLDVRGHLHGNRHG